MQPAIFTRENPCTKVHLHNAFVKVNNVYGPTSVVEFCSIAGVNSRKYLKREGYVREYLLGGVDYIELTEEGREWLRKGLARHLELHPEDAPSVRSGMQGVRRIIRRK